ncbi:response regulator [Salinivirga cyanobacteriivorans]
MATMQPNILIIDDDRVSQIYLGELIGTLLPGASIVKADSGEKALDLINRTDFDFVFSDIRMPGLSGESLFEELVKATKKCENCRIYAISGISEQDTLNIRNAGAVAVLRKPVEKFRLEELFFGNVRSESEKNKFSAANKESLIDPQKIIKLYEYNYDKVAQILKLYQQTLPDQMNRLQIEWDARNYEEVRNLGHSLKNSFTYLGADMLKDKAHSLEEIIEEQTEITYVDSIVKDISGASGGIEKKIAELIESYEHK